MILDQLKRFAVEAKQAAIEARGAAAATQGLVLDQSRVRRPFAVREEAIARRRAEEQAAGILRQQGLT